MSGTLFRNSLDTCRAELNIAAFLHCGKTRLSSRFVLAEMPPTHKIPLGHSRGIMVAVFQNCCNYPGTL